MFEHISSLFPFLSVILVGTAILSGVVMGAYHVHHALFGYSNLWLMDEADKDKEREGNNLPVCSVRIDRSHRMTRRIWQSSGSRTWEVIECSFLSAVL